MTKAAKELEARRLDIKPRWWWRDPAHERAKSAAALAWETLRRTQSYSALWRKAVRERGAFLGNKDAPNRGGEKLRLMHLFTRSRDGIGKLCWQYLMNGFDPEKTWLELNKRQRLTAQGYVIDGNEALKNSEAWTLPRQDYSELPLGVVSVGLCELAKDGNGKVSVRKSIRGCEPLEFITGTESFQRLSPIRYVICYFDIRPSREKQLQAWDAEMTRGLGPPSADGSCAICWNPTTRKPTAFWTPDADARMRPGRDEVHILPSNDPALVILLLPAKYNRGVFRSVFQGMWKKEQRNKWLPRCVKFWKTLTVPIERFPRNPDGTERIELDAEGRLIRERVEKPVFDPKLHLPPKEKRGKSGARKNLWLGLAACDVISIDEQLGKSSDNARVLVEHCENYSALSNHQRTAKAYLNEIDASLGRLDKKLAHGLRENARLSL